MEIEKIRPIPQYIIRLIQKRDKKEYPEQKGNLRFYSYLTKNDGELVRVTVAVKCRYKKWYCKQVAVHGLNSEFCFYKDIDFYYICGYVVTWYDYEMPGARCRLEKEVWDIFEDKYFNPYAPVVNIEFLNKYPEYKYSAYAHYDDPDIIKYLRIYERYPQAEYLVKLGLNNLARSVTILKRIGKDKAFCKWLIKHKDELNKYYVCTIIESYRTGKPLDAVQKLARFKKSFAHDKDYKPIRELFKGRRLEQFFNYIDKQGVNVRYYLDYLRACNYLNLDMSEPKNAMPHDLKLWHDTRVEQYQTLKFAEEEKKRKQQEKEQAIKFKKFGVIANKYLPLQSDNQNGFLVFIAKSPAELVREGNILSHCVGGMGYDQKMIREESLIFFIRNIAEPDKPFVTMEYSIKSKRVLQCYACHNTKPSDAVLDFVNNQWLPFANKQLSNIKKSKNKAA